MSLETRLADLILVIGGEHKTLRTALGNLAALTTAEKTSLVAAINELQSEINAIGSGGAAMLDTAGDGDTTHTYSADKILDLLASLKSEILGGASSAWDTLQEIQAWATNNETAISGLLTAVGNRVAYDAAQSLTTGQKAQACANIGIGDPETDLVALFNAAKA